uniref:Uncharacterized protein n=1 Tax=Anopheles dirus TaxID=7168 RepID=A0A182N4T7_9DIPT
MSRSTRRGRNVPGTAPEAGGDPGRKRGAPAARRRVPVTGGQSGAGRATPGGTGAEGYAKAAAAAVI